MLTTPSARVTLVAVLASYCMLVLLVLGGGAGSGSGLTLAHAQNPYVKNAPAAFCVYAGQNFSLLNTNYPLFTPLSWRASDKGYAFSFCGAPIPVIACNNATICELSNSDARSIANAMTPPQWTYISPFEVHFTQPALNYLCPNNQTVTTVVFMCDSGAQFGSVWGLVASSDGCSYTITVGTVFACNISAPNGTADASSSAAPFSPNTTALSSSFYSNSTNNTSVSSAFSPNTTSLSSSLSPNATNSTTGGFSSRFSPNTTALSSSWRNSTNNTSVSSAFSPNTTSLSSSWRNTTSNSSSGGWVPPRVPLRPVTSTPSSYTLLNIAPSPPPSSYPIVQTFSGDDGVSLCSLGFTVTIYGKSYAYVYVSTNGNVQFMSYSSTFDQGSTVPPSPSLLKYVSPWIALFHADLYVLSSSPIQISVVGSKPYRMAVIRYQNVVFNGGQGTVNLDLQLFEQSDVIEVVYYALQVPAGLKALVGIQIGLNQSTASYNDYAYLPFVNASNVAAVAQWTIMYVPAGQLAPPATAAGSPSYWAQKAIASDPSMQQLQANGGNVPEASVRGSAVVDAPWFIAAMCAFAVAVVSLVTCVALKRHMDSKRKGETSIELMDGAAHDAAAKAETEAETEATPFATVAASRC